MYNRHITRHAAVVGRGCALMGSYKGAGAADLWGLVIIGQRSRFATAAKKLIRPPAIVSSCPTVCEHRYTTVRVRVRACNCVHVCVCVLCR